MAVSAIDSRLFRNLFGTQEIRDVFSDESYTQCMIETEAALARAQSKTGVIPTEAGSTITESFRHVKLDDAAKYIHWGATTQDIMDDASMIQIKKGLQIVKRYLDELDVDLEDLELLLPLGLTTQGLRVRAQLAKELGLEDPPITWHVMRDNIAEILNFLGLLGGTLGKIAYDIMIMSSNELSEVSEPFVPHRGASSTMPQKRNPISSEVVLAASKLLRANAGLGLDAMVTDFERASGPWHLEWVAIPDSFTLAVGALHQMSFAMSGLVVNQTSMLDNLNSSRGLIVGEAVMMGLAPYIGRQVAHDVVYSACKESIETRSSLLDVLTERNDVVDKVDRETLTRLCNPTNYLGASQLMVDDMLKVTKGSFPHQGKGYGNGNVNGYSNAGLTVAEATKSNGARGANGIVNGTVNGVH
ncbi:hypothetical protein Dsin_023512 [Dipteronia sinensis]|uniref:Adenylosuccinate lyase C-terminal domain-containing protein n=1 Tax=Dipteronia sinensis TaxID=43782 RepID=A0AAE0E260_9ROSI|nr:hypothetical protein Dsin_023512 [Dipteronia sinensis]